MRGHFRCDSAFWPASPYRMAAVEKTGVRPAGYVLDWPELDYGYRARWLGLTSYMSRISVFDNRWTGTQVASRIRRLGLAKFRLYAGSPIRGYCHVRN